MAIVPPPSPAALPTNGAPLPRVASAQSLSLERYLARTKCGISSLALALVWLALPRRGSGQAHHGGA